ncbi:hypothetical protein [Clostridium lacusfryxellense]|uniref:hypothetical protein n=1 Tax=Clostridium lacusfryxellense TaxID=205328 RepID=UPI001C0AF1E1|nr:hypothetical protein [Clostridium lacusfryxellense]MBU3110614.1 hypothetical protein [Clostridium lacusfryxellense]
MNTMKSVMKTICILLISLMLVFKPIYVLLSLSQNSNIFVLIYILNIIIIIYGGVILILNKINPLNLKWFITYYSIDTIFIMIAIVICYRLSITRLNIVEQGLVGSSFDIIINILIIIFSIKEIRNNSYKFNN